MKKKFLKTSVGLLLFVTLISGQSVGQSLTTGDIRSFLVKEWERAKAYTNEYLDAMPRDKYGFRAVDSIRSFAEQMLHLAQANLFLMSAATDQAPPSFLSPTLEKSPTAQAPDSVRYYVNASYDFCINAVKNSDMSKWGEKKKVFIFENTRYAFMTKVFEHQTHHRGQTTIYIRLLGIKPPEEKLF